MLEEGDGCGGRGAFLSEVGAVDERGHGLRPEAGDDEEDDEANEDAAGGAVEADGRFVERFGPVHGFDRAEVIVEGGNGGEDDEAEEEVESPMPGNKDDKELGDEAAQGWYASQGDEREGEGGGEQRGALGESGQVMNFESGQAALKDGEDDEGGEGGE